MRQRVQNSRSDPHNGPKKSLVVRAHAKINLDLRIIGPRPDGYHELRTVFQTIRLHDTLTFTATTRAFELRCSLPGVPADDTNLIWRAARALWSAADRRGDLRGVDVRLEKKIPAQAGLGGGSSDAAATLLALSDLWRLKMDRSRLAEIASTLGADVPFFLCGGTALGVGRGDEIYPLEEIPKHWVVLLIPDFGVATSDAYAWVDADRASAGPASAGLHDEGRDSEMWRPASAGPRVQTGAVGASLFGNPLHLAELRNDFQPVVEARHPLLETLRERLLQSGVTVAALSGSGSSVFGLFKSEERARMAVRSCRDLPCRSLATRTISRRELARIRRVG